MRQISTFVRISLVFIVASCGGDVSPGEFATAAIDAPSATTVLLATTTTRATTTTTTTTVPVTTTTELEDVVDLDALLEAVPALEGEIAGMEEIGEEGVHVWGTSNRPPEEGKSRAVELTLAFQAAVEESGWTLLNPDPQCMLPAGSIIDANGRVVGDPFECGTEATNEDGRYLSIYAGGEPILYVDLCVWPSEPRLDCPRSESG